MLVAVEKENLDIVKLLFKCKNIDINIINKEYISPLLTGVYAYSYPPKAGYEYTIILLFVLFLFNFQTIFIFYSIQIKFFL